MTPMTTSLASDTETLTDLVAAAQTGDRDALGRLLARYEPTILAYCLRQTRNMNDAQELAQDVFIQVLRKIRQLRTPECFAGWVRSIARRLAINRAVRRWPVRLAEQETLAAASVHERTPLDDALATERSAELRTGLGRLRELDRRTLEAFYVEGRSLHEMCDQFHAPLGTIKRRLHTARKRLAEEVEETCGVA